MKVLFITEVDTIKDHKQYAKCTKVCRVLIVEDDGSEDGGRTIAKVWRKTDANAIATAMKWEVTDETR